MASAQEKMYELAYLASPDLNEQGVAALKDEVDTLVVKCGGAIREHQETSRRTLAYPLKKERQAYLVSELIMIPPTDKTLLEKELRFQKSLLRHLLVAMPEKLLARLRAQRLAELKPVRRGPPKEKPPVFKYPATAGTEKPAEEREANIAEIEKKLDEILGREF